MPDPPIAGIGDDRFGTTDNVQEDPPMRRLSAVPTRYHSKPHADPSMAVRACLRAALVQESARLESSIEHQ